MPIICAVRLAQTIAAVLALSSTQGCSARDGKAEETFNSQQSVQEADQRLRSSHPVGSKLSAAKAHLESLGFRCQPLGSGQAPYQTSMLCTVSVIRERAGTPLTAPLAPNTWLVALDSSDGVTLSRLKTSRLP